MSSSLQPYGPELRLLCPWDSPFPLPGDLPDPGVELTSPSLAGRFSTTEPPGKLPCLRKRKPQCWCPCSFKTDIIPAVTSLMLSASPDDLIAVSSPSQHHALPRSLHGPQGLLGLPGCVLGLCLSDVPHPKVLNQLMPDYTPRYVRKHHKCIQFSCSSVCQ